MPQILMKAIRTFVGLEGFKRRGEEFYVRSDDRARQLQEVQLAELVTQVDPEQPEEENISPPNENDSNNEQEFINEDLNPPSNGEAWGIISLGGGWYELPTGERVRGFEQANKKLYFILRDKYGRNVKEANQAELVTPTNKQVYDADSPIIWTGETEESNVSPEEDSETNIEPPQEDYEDGNSNIPEEEENVPRERRFEDEVRYLGGGWYLLPNGERVQGKESARDLWESYIEEGGF